MSAWTVYFIAVAVFVMLLYIISRNWPFPLLRIIVLGALVLLLMTPVGVTGTEQLAPAWLVIVFESIFGSAQLATSAGKPVVLMFAVYTAILVAVAILVHRRRQQKK